MDGVPGAPPGAHITGIIVPGCCRRTRLRSAPATDPAAGRAGANPPAPEMRDAVAAQAGGTDGGEQKMLCPALVFRTNTIHSFIWQPTAFSSVEQTLQRDAGRLSFHAYTTE